jgi:hypothetical protein
MKSKADLLKAIRKAKDSMDARIRDFESTPQMSVNKDPYVIGHFETLMGISKELGKWLKEYKDEDVKVSGT